MSAGPSLGRRERVDRGRARSWAVQILYGWEATGADRPLRDVLIETAATRRIAPSRLAMVRALMDSIDAHREEIDRRIEESLENWTLARLSVIDRSILRLAAAEILFHDDIPPKVSLQEAVRLAEMYGGQESPRFVNGVLDALYKRSLSE